MHEITGLLLAAGSSSRFGGHKLLTQIRGEPLARLSAESLSACDHVIAVVREDDGPLQQYLQSVGIEFVINRQAGQGMGSSLACGIRASELSDGWCILPADMPYVERSTTLRVVEALRKGAEIAAPVYQGRRGHPVGFCTTYRDQLLLLDNDVGAREILTRQAEKVESIEVENSGILIDIDIPEDVI